MRSLGGKHRKHSMELTADLKYLQDSELASSGES